jgi:ribosomal protein S18 acetylase RimI-like enzyme
MRLEVHEHNTRAIARYEKSGYRLFGRHRDYYDDHGDALRFEKPLDAAPRSTATAPGKGLHSRANRL